MKSLFYYQKEAEFPLGFVADFCPIEREITTYSLRAVHLSAYINFIRVSKGRFIRNDRCCCSCGIVLPNDKTVYKSINKSREDCIATLEQATHPGASEYYEDLIKLNYQEAAIGPALKQLLLREQFTLLERIAKQLWASETKLDSFALYTGLASGASFFVALVLISKIANENSRMDAIGYVFGFGFLLLVLNAVVFFRAPRRAIYNKVFPLMATALAPLNLSKQDLTEILADMKAEGFTHSTKLSADKLLQAMEQRRNSFSRKTPISGKIS